MLRQTANKILFSKKKKKNYLLKNLPCSTAQFSFEAFLVIYLLSSLPGTNIVDRTANQFQVGPPIVQTWPFITVQITEFLVISKVRVPAWAHTWYAKFYPNA